MSTEDVTGLGEPSSTIKVVVLAGGLGTRLAEETETKPKPIVEIGDHPILWHILKHYAHYGHNEFFIALGYKGDEIKRYFVDRRKLSGDMTLVHGEVVRRGRELDNWTLHLIDTGKETLTGGRLKRLEPFVREKTFMLTYGDGVSDVNVEALLRFHRACGRMATITAVRPPARFGGLVFDGDLVSEFSEKPQTGEGWINGGYMVFEPGIFDQFLTGDCSLESSVLEKLALAGQLAAYRHEGFWQCMDTLRDKRLLDSLWRSQRAPWKIWNDTLESDPSLCVGHAAVTSQPKLLI